MDGATPASLPPSTWAYRALTIRQRGDVQLVSSAALLEELADVLTRASPAKRLAAIGKTAQAVLSDYVEVVEVVAPAEMPRVVPSYADDDHVIAAAVASDAKLIVSGDSDLLGMDSHQGIEILSAAMALETVGSTGESLARAAHDPMLPKRRIICPSASRASRNGPLEGHPRSLGRRRR